MAQSVSTVVLEPAAQEVARMTANPPFLFQLGPEKGRAKLAELQSGNTPRPEVDIEDIMVPGGPSGQVPSGSSGPGARDPGTTVWAAANCSIGSGPPHTR